MISMDFLVTAFFNLNSRDSFMDGYSPDHHLVTSGLGEREVSAATVQRAAEQVWAELNRDDRPNGRMERSLSVGDALRVVDMHSARTYWLDCRNTGWALMDDAPSDALVSPWIPFTSWPRYA
jgi:hypothetical protein